MCALYSSLSFPHKSSSSLLKQLKLILITGIFLDPANTTHQPLPHPHDRLTSTLTHPLPCGHTRFQFPDLWIASASSAGILLLRDNLLRFKRNYPTEFYAFILKVLQLFKLMKNLWCNPRRVKPSVCVCEFLAAQSCPTPWDAPDSSQPCSCLSRFSRQEQKWTTMSSFRGSSQPGDGTQVSRIVAGFFPDLSHQEVLKYFSTLTRCLGNRM